VTASPIHLAGHQRVAQSPAYWRWDGDSLDRSSIESMMRAASPAQSARCIQSYSQTSVRDIEAALDFSLKPAAQRSRCLARKFGDRIPKQFWLEILIQRQRPVALMIVAREHLVDPAVAIRNTPGQDRIERRL